MLANPIFLISLNQWSKILTRTLNLNLIHGQYNCMDVPHKKEMIEGTQMSEDNSKPQLVETPSSGSGLSNWNCECGNIEKSSCRKSSVSHSSRNECNSEENISNLILNPVIVMQSVTSTISSVGYCQSSNIHFNEFPVSESLSKRYCHRYQIDEDDSAGTTSMGRNKEDPYGTSRTRITETYVLDKLWAEVAQECNAMDGSQIKIYGPQECGKKTTDGKSNSKPGFIFTLMCYNVLAQDLLKQHPYLYRDHHQGYLSWETRWKNLFKEIKRLSPDILCLQEVQESHIKDYFSLLETLGYRSLYKKRTGGRTEGCALYYKTELINLVEYTAVEYYQPGVSILNRDNVAIIAKFVPKLHPTREFVIATTHLLYNPRRQDVRLAQMQVLLTEVERISYIMNSKNGGYLPVIITGDLNSTPDTALYEFVAKGRLNYEFLSPKSLIKDTDVYTGKVLVPPDLLITGLIYVKKDKGYPEDKIKLLSRYRLPTKNELRDVRVPNSVFGSDHLSLMAKFKLEY
ncbi:hypothetical protein NQ314_003253 [Rhamnusium bicolor]|uniref:Endonuclease/exonuclease/phosphatase domain-containing protein n=1 Tax=Rhamnusium bicolor TaxID=1586634 RepID=A0AAV8ZNA2_9CUCU|nr:hypothetical protein NQ314_003253 [Rhamnusium bicolor]